MEVRCERVYDHLRRERDKDEVVILVDRIWPRGVRKENLQLDEWLKDLAPSGELRRWFAHDPERWSGFKSRYLHELEHCLSERERLRAVAAGSPLTLLYSARDERHNQAVVLREWLAGNI